MKNVCWFSKQALCAVAWSRDSRLQNDGYSGETCRQKQRNSVTGWGEMSPFVTAIAPPFLNIGSGWPLSCAVPYSTSIPEQKLLFFFNRPLRGWPRQPQDISLVSLFPKHAGSWESPSTLVSQSQWSWRFLKPLSLSLFSLSLYLFFCFSLSLSISSLSLSISLHLSSLSLSSLSSLSLSLSLLCFFFLSLSLSIFLFVFSLSLSLFLLSLFLLSLLSLSLSLSLLSLSSLSLSLSFFFFFSLSLSSLSLSLSSLSLSFFSLSTHLWSSILLPGWTALSWNDVGSLSHQVAWRALFARNACPMCKQWSSWSLRVWSHLQPSQCLLGLSPDLLILQQGLRLMMSCNRILRRGQQVENKRRTECCKLQKSGYYLSHNYYTHSLLFGEEFRLASVQCYTEITPALHTNTSGELLQNCIIVLDNKAHETPTTHSWDAKILGGNSFRSKRDAKHPVLTHKNIGEFNLQSFRDKNLRFGHLACRFGLLERRGIWCCDSGRQWERSKSPGLTLNDSKITKHAHPKIRWKGRKVQKWYFWEISSMCWIFFKQWPRCWPCCTAGTSCLTLINRRVKEGGQYATTDNVKWVSVVSAHCLLLSLLLCSCWAKLKQVVTKERPSVRTKILWRSDRLWPNWRQTQPVWREARPNLFDERIAQFRAPVREIRIPTTWHYSKITDKRRKTSPKVFTSKHPGVHQN